MRPPPWTPRKSAPWMRPRRRSRCCSPARRHAYGHGDGKQSALLALPFHIPAQAVVVRVAVRVTATANRSARVRARASDCSGCAIAVYCCASASAIVRATRNTPSPNQCPADSRGGSRVHLARPRTCPWARVKGLPGMCSDGNARWSGASAKARCTAVGVVGRSTARGNMCRVFRKSHALFFPSANLSTTRIICYSHEANDGQPIEGLIA